MRSSPSVDDGGIYVTIRHFFSSTAMTTTTTLRTNSWDTCPLETTNTGMLNYRPTTTAQEKKTLFEKGLRHSTLQYDAGTDRAVKGTGRCCFRYWCANRGRVHPSIYREKGSGSMITYGCRSGSVIDEEGSKGHKN